MGVNKAEKEKWEKGCDVACVQEKNKTHTEDKDGLPYLTDHRVSVDLSHVLSTILLLYCFDVETPHGVVRVGHGHTGIVCDDVSVNCLYSFRVCTDPANLEKYMIEIMLQNFGGS